MIALSKWLARVAMIAAALSSLFATAGTITYFHNDLLGSPIAATNASGQVIWRESYRPYGERLTNDANDSANNVWFTSRRQDAETGLVYMGARYYEPVVGRFMGVDPKLPDEANPHSFNRYAYANNNPLKYTDPDGREPSGDMVTRGYVPPVPEWMRDWRKQGLENVCVECAFLPAMRWVKLAAELGSSANDSSNAEVVRKPDGIPDNWVEQPTRDGSGREWINPENSHDRIRSMPGDPASPNPAQRQPYVRDVKDGNKWLDVDGNRIEGQEGRNSPSTHVPTQDYKFPGN